MRKQERGRNNKEAERRWELMAVPQSDKTCEVSEARHANAHASPIAQGSFPCQSYAGSVQGSVQCLIWHFTVTDDIKNEDLHDDIFRHLTW